MFEETISQLFTLRGYDPNDNKIRVFCIESLAVSDLEEFLEEGCSSEVRKMIVVCEHIRVAAKKIAFYRSLCDLDVFEIEWLKLMLKGHRLIPPHERLSTLESQQISSRYGFTNLPALCISDPMCKLNDFKIGDIVRITRPRGIYYRRVVAD